MIIIILIITIIMLILILVTIMIIISIIHMATNSKHQTMNYTYKQTNTCITST